MLFDAGNVHSLPDAAQEFFGGAVSYHTVRRWIVKGVGIPPVKLRAVRIGKRYFVTRDACEEFLDALADPRLHANRQRTERCEKAKRKLQRAGA